MGSITLTPQSYSVQKQRVTLYAVLNIGGTGAVTLEQWTPGSANQAAGYAAASTSAANAFSPGGTQGIATVTRTGTGKYRIVTQDKYQRLLGVRASFIVATTGIPAAPDVGIVKPSGVNGLTTNNTVDVQFSAAGVATDPASGEQVIVELTLDASGAI